MRFDAVDDGRPRTRMHSIHWFSLVTFIIGLGLLFVGFPTVGWLILVGSAVIELVYSAVSGKKTNDGTH